MKNSSFCWRGTTEDLKKSEEEEREIPALYDLNLTVSRGQLVGIAGGVGAGKSSLISAILGEVRVVTDIKHYTLHHTPYTLHLTHYTLHLTPYSFTLYTLHFTLYNLYLTP